jgi:hypothetical protein
MGGSLPQPATRHPADQPPAAPRFNRALLPAELPAIGVSLRGGESGAGGDPRGPGLCRASPLQPCCRRARGGPWRQASAQRAFRSQFSIVWSECVTIGAFLSRGVGSRFEGEVTAVLLGALPDLALGARALPPPHARDARNAVPLKLRSCVGASPASLAVLTRLAARDEVVLVVGSPPQPLGHIAAQCASGLHLERLVDRLGRHPHLRVIGDSTRSPPAICSGD